MHAQTTNGLEESGFLFNTLKAAGRSAQLKADRA